ncbi:MAG: MarR family winged helix-turn-helix transcriptional regulator [Actinomycetota bacterium]|nr:MarR family winged helix-turn-helix transcriptional regulator [Actinomycetota bacterium]
MTHLLEEACIAARVRRIHRVVVSRYDEALRSLGITIGQLDMLVTLLDVGDVGDVVSPAALGRALLMERSTVSRNVRRLESLGLVRISGTAPHGQAVQLTDAGKRLIDRAYEPWSNVQSEIKSEIGPQGLQALDLLVDRLGKES